MNISTIPTEQLVQELSRRMSDNRVNDIVSEVSDEYGVGVDEIMSYSKEPLVCEARSLAMGIAAEQYTLAYVSRVFNRKNHTTVISAKKRVAELLANDAVFRKRASRVISKLNERKILKKKG